MNISCWNDQVLYNDEFPCGNTDKKGKSEGFDSYDRPSNLTKIGFKSSIFQPFWPWNGWHRKAIGHLLDAMSSFVHHFKSIGEFKQSYSPETLNSGQN